MIHHTSFEDLCSSTLCTVVDDEELAAFTPLFMESFLSPTVLRSRTELGLMVSRPDTV